MSEKKNMEIEDPDFRPKSPVKARKIRSDVSKSPGAPKARGRGRPRKDEAPGTPKTPSTPRKRSSSRSRTRKAVTEPQPPRPQSRTSKRKDVVLCSQPILVQQTTPLAVPKGTRAIKSETRSILKTSQIETRSSRSRTAAQTANTAASSSAASVPHLMSNDEEKALRRRIVAGSSVSPSVQERTRVVATQARTTGYKIINSNAFKVVLGIFIIFTIAYYLFKSYPNAARDSSIYVTNNYYYLRDQAVDRFNDLSASIQSSYQKAVAPEVAAPVATPVVADD